MAVSGFGPIRLDDAAPNFWVFVVNETERQTLDPQIRSALPGLTSVEAAAAVPQDLNGYALQGEPATVTWRDRAGPVLFRGERLAEAVAVEAEAHLAGAFDTLGDEDGDVAVMEHGKTFKLVSEQNMGSSVYATPVPANGAMFIMNRNQLYALAEGAQALIHNGKHGNLEWLPGKALALSETCFPEAVFGPLPHLYPFIVNDPGEGTQAKRRSSAVIIDHLTPPLTRAESYGPLKDLEALVDEYYEASGGDPRRLVLLKKQILELIADMKRLNSLFCSSAYAVLGGSDTGALMIDSA